MPDGSSADGPASTSSQSGSGTAPLSHLPWGLIPAFRPGETDINEYAKKLEFLAGLWPQEHLALLAPRAAMMCEGSAFKKILRIDTEKLKVNSADGVKLLVQSLGGIWGKSNLEEKFERFERAIFSTTQRADETNESYLARHDFQFEELLQMGVGFKEMRAYILLRNSGLQSEDKKKLVVDSKGSLEYDSTVSSLKLLGSKFFNEVNFGSKTPARSKTYDVNAVFEEEQPALVMDEDSAFVGDSWDDGEVIYDDADPDAIICMQFEDSILEALQGDMELAACYNTYLDARKRLQDRNKSRGFWGNSKGYQSTSKGKGKSRGKNMFRSRKPLAQRILESECRRCGQKGHWKAECPLNRGTSAITPANSGSKDGAFAGMTMITEGFVPDNDMILVTEHAEVSLTDVCTGFRPVHDMPFCGVSVSHAHTTVTKDPSALTGPLMSRFLSRLKQHLSPRAKPVPDVSMSLPKSPVDCSASVNHPSSHSVLIQQGSMHDALFVSHGPFGIVDLGASQTVIGVQQVPDLLSHLPKGVRDRVQKVPCHTMFRFGNSSTVECREAFMVPLDRWHVKICVVHSQTPFLVSNNVFRTLGAQIDTAEDSVTFSKIHVKMPLTLTAKKLYLIDFCELIRLANATKEHAVKLRCSVDRCQILLTVMAAAPSLAERFHAVTAQKSNEEFRKMSYDQLSKMRISFGEAKLNQRFIEVVTQDPKYTAWFAKKYESSQKPAHQAFLYFINLYVERLELTQESPEIKYPSALELKAKAKAGPPQGPEVQSHSSWSDEDASKPWSVIHEEQTAQVKGELENQNSRLETVESSLQMISQQLQMLTQAMMSQSPAGQH
eukprot:s628_g3.t1